MWPQAFSEDMTTGLSTAISKLFPMTSNGWAD
jgi:hypothetical protein